MLYLKLQTALIIALHNVFDRGFDFYKDIVTYYKQQPDPDVTVIEYDMDNDSESDREETV